MQLVVTVRGTPAPQGSKTRKANGAMVESSKALPAWREAIRHTASGMVAEVAWTPPLAAFVTVTFTVARPGLHYRTGKYADRLKDTAPPHPTGRPDLDKLCRAALDALTDAGALTDDARVVGLYAQKAYPGGALDALDTPGAVIVVDPL
jgi:crossover junction endodeoxyribonuclease RusA